MAARKRMLPFANPPDPALLGRCPAIRLAPWCWRIRGYRGVSVRMRQQRCRNFGAGKATTVSPFPGLLRRLFGPDHT